MTSTSAPASSVPIAATPTPQEAVVAVPAVAVALHTPRPTFDGLLRGELFKLSRQWTTWLLALGVFVMVTGMYVVSLTIPFLKTGLTLLPLAALYQIMENGLLVLRVFTGTFLIITTARLIGMEYSGGTIRVLLSRGVGRLQLLGAKLLAIWIVALGMLILGILYNALLTCLLLLVEQGNLSALSALDAPFWADAWLYVVTVIISMAVTILMTACATVVSRSLAAGLAAGLSFFAADNIGLVFLFLAYRLTQSDFWLNISAYFLGPNLNAMPAALLSPDAALQRIKAMPTPWVPVDAAHTLAVTCVWALAFAATTVLLTWRRDVNE